MKRIEFGYTRFAVILVFEKDLSHLSSAQGTLCSTAFLSSSLKTKNELSCLNNSTLISLIDCVINI